MHEEVRVGGSLKRGRPEGFGLACEGWEHSCAAANIFISSEMTSIQDAHDRWQFCVGYWEVSSLL